MVGAASADASTLGVTAFNVGMLDEKAFGSKQNSKVSDLAELVCRWLALDHGPANVVGLNEIAPSIAQKLVEKLQGKGLDVGFATHESNTLLWRLSMLSLLVCFPLCWCMRQEGRAGGATESVDAAPRLRPRLRRAFDVLNQIGGCPTEFVDGVNADLAQHVRTPRLPCLPPQS